MESRARAAGLHGRGAALIARVSWLGSARFVFKHAVATTVVWVGCAALVCVAYFALLVYAMFTDGGLGGPLALPFFVVVAALFGMAVSVCVCLPATAFAELVRRWRRWRLVWEVPLFGFPLGAFVVLLACLNREWADVPQPDTLWAVIAGSLFVLLLVYWCALQLVELAYWLVGRAWRAFTWRLGD